MLYHKARRFLIYLGSSGTRQVYLQALGFEPIDLPPRLRDLAAERGMLVYARRQR